MTSQPERRPAAGRRAILAAAGALLPALAHAQAPRFPARGVRLVVPFTPGGQTDIMARLLGARLSAVWGGPVVVENRPGGNGITGAEAALRAAPDGHTLLLITSTHAINATLVPEAPYDFARDVAPLSLLGSLPLVAVVPAASPWPDLAAVAAAGRGRALNGGSSGTGTPAHLALELFRREAGIGAALAHVPYRGGAPAVTDLAAGTLDIMFANLPDALAAIQAGRLRALAVTAERRQRLLPGVPTVAEAGFGGLQIGSWTALVAAASVPAALRGRIAADASAAVTDPATASRAAEAGFDILGWGERETAAFVAAEVARWGALVREAEIRAEG
jgi:tripartite-type tricarboxylate transporter receptor subunit TctC